MKPESGRKTRSLGDGRNAEPGPLRRATRGRRRPIFSEPSVLPKEKVPDSSLPSCNSEAMALHLEEISLAVAPEAHALVLLDQAGWHVSKKLPVPGNITLVPLPPKSPELNPVENIWQFMRDNWLSNRVFKSYDDILDHCCFAWNKLIDMPWKIMSIGIREWAYRS